MEEVRTVLSQPVIEQLIDKAVFTKAGTLHFSGNGPQLCLAFLFYFFFSTKAYVVGNLKNRLYETVLLDTPKYAKIYG